MIALNAISKTSGYLPFTRYNKKQPGHPRLFFYGLY